MTVVFDFSDPCVAARWESVNDTVMGGRSSSSLQLSPVGTACFSGELSLESGGGFASAKIRTAPPLSVSAKSLVLRVRGDGRTYKLRLWTSQSISDYSYLAPFLTVLGKWTEHTFTVSDFNASWRGRPVTDPHALRFEDVLGFGLLLADGQAGRFELDLAWLIAR